MVNLLPGEKIVFLKRRYWFVLLLESLPVGFFVLMISAAPFAATFLFPEIFDAYRKEIFLAVGLAAQTALVIFFLIFADYYLDIWLVTGKRVIFSEIHGLFNRRTSSIDFERIQDVSVEIHGFIPTILNFGDLKIQTAGAEPPFIFKQISAPDETKNKILALKEKRLKEISGERF